MQYVIYTFLERLRRSKFTATEKKKRMMCDKIVFVKRLCVCVCVCEKNVVKKK